MRSPPACPPADVQGGKTLKALRGAGCFDLSTRFREMMPDSILIAEDFDDNRELLRMILESGGYSIREARNGREALDAVRAQRPSLAIIDLSMPALDGWSLLRELRSDERTRTLPCVALTAFAGEQDRQRALEAGFDAYISKPYRAKELLDLVREMLHKCAPAAADGRAPARGDLP